MWSSKALVYVRFSLCSSDSASSGGLEHSSFALTQLEQFGYALSHYTSS